MAITISPTEKVDRLSKIIATISDPSNEPPLRIISPTPIPKIIPPKIAPKNGSVVIGVKRCAMVENIAIHIIENKVDKVNPLPITL